MVAMYFLLESKGISSILGRSSASRSLSRPALAATTTRAPSVGSPRISHLSPSPSSEALRTESLHRAAIWRNLERSGSPAGSIRAPSISNSPWGRKPAPETSTIPFPRKIFWTVIWLVVRVPVLSVQMAVTEPRASTASSFRMMAFLFAILPTPTARVTVITAGRPSGIAETAIARVKRASSMNSKPLRSPAARVTLLATRARIISFLLRSRVRPFRGVAVFPVFVIIPAIFPISVAIPVEKTRAFALP